MKILRASAGSGKTYRLSKAYIGLLLSSGQKDAYRHILAVTFTNKATEEMKERILDDLYRLSSENPRARELLVAMLHDYGSFSVSTIDHFFQRTLKAFSREIGQFADYQIELDRKSLIQEAMDRILDSLTPDDRELVRWISGSLEGSLERGSELDIEGSLYDMGNQLKSEECGKLAESLGIDMLAEYSKDRLERLGKACAELRDSFIDALRNAGLEDVSRSERFRLEGRKRALKKLPGAMEVVEEGFRAYNTACEIGDRIFSLGFAGEFYSAFDALLREKNVMCLDESNLLLRDIIGDSDAPFIYEKVGVRYDSFLLDEFQDTSNVQWNNFLPLLRESESRGGHNLIVGDVKQSIYRFRDSDWSLLASGVLEAFPDAEVETLQGNWRSSREVVSFNNGFFRMASERLGLSDIYADVAQEVMRGDAQGGRVEVDFCSDQLEKTYGCICRARDAGASFGDIAVLVRNRKVGAAVADYLLQKGVPVISDDSLDVKSSPAVNRVVSLLTAYDNPDDVICAYIAGSLGIEFRPEYHSLVDLCESLLRALCAACEGFMDGETLFVQAFMDEVRSWSETNGNNIRQFLRHWDETDLAIGSPRNENALRVCTIHKSKGLQFPYVIFPFADKVELYRPGVRWCSLDAAKCGLPEVMSGIYPVNLGGDKADTFFDGELERERRRQLVDNINLFYVAMTRAEKALSVISAPPTKKFAASLSSGSPEYSRLSDLLYEYVGGMDSISYGEPYDFGAIERRTVAEHDFFCCYPSVPLGGRLAPSGDAEDFFGDGSVTGVVASARLRGIVLHSVLSSVTGPESLGAAVRNACADGLLSEAESRECMDFLSSRIASRPEWFPSGDTPGVEVLSETGVFDSTGREHRPDRVLVYPDGVRIIDFKFGDRREKSHLRQIERYAALYESLGFEVLECCLWYVEQDEIISI